MSYSSFDFPHTHFYDDDLRELIKKVFDMSIEVKNFVSVNAIKYANPIQWNITSQYEKNTIVIDPLTGTAYISVAAVPSGVAITREEFWTVVFDLGQFVVRASKNFSNRYEQKTTLTATFPTSAGQWLVWGDVLYKALTNIIAGDTYVVGSNISHFTIENLYNALLDTIGNLDDLNTDDKSSIVAAINEVNTTGGGALALIGDLADLNAGGDTVVEGINNVFQALTKHAPINVGNYGIVGDGVTDDSAAFQAMIDALNDEMLLLIPADYIVYLASPVTINKCVKIISGSGNRQATILTGTTNTAFIVNSRGVIFEDLLFTATDYKADGYFIDVGAIGQMLINNCAFTKWACAIRLNSASYTKITNCSFFDESSGSNVTGVASTAILAGDIGYVPGLNINNCYFWTSTDTNYYSTYMIYLANVDGFHLTDCEFVCHGHAVTCVYSEPLTDGFNGAFQICNCMFDSGTIGIRISPIENSESRNILIANCTFISCRNNAIHLRPKDGNTPVNAHVTNVSIMGCYFLAPTNYGIYVGHLAANINITGNNFYGGKEHIHCDSDASNIIINGNICVGSELTNHALTLIATVHDVSILNNRTSGAQSKGLYITSSGEGIKVNDSNVFNDGCTPIRYDALLIESGATSDRPASAPVGRQFFDNTLGKPIYYSGSHWVDATGATV